MQTKRGALLWSNPSSCIYSMTPTYADICLENERFENKVELKMNSGRPRQKHRASRKCNKNASLNCKQTSHTDKPGGHEGLRDSSASFIHPSIRPSVAAAWVWGDVRRWSHHLSIQHHIPSAITQACSFPFCLICFHVHLLRYLPLIFRVRGSGRWRDKQRLCAAA